MSQTTFFLLINPLKRKGNCVKLNLQDILLAIDIFTLSIKICFFLISNFKLILLKKQKKAKNRIKREKTKKET